MNYILGKTNITPEQYKNILLRAVAEEFQAWYQYFIVAPFLTGNEGQRTRELLKELADDELNDHATKILERMNQLGMETYEIQAPESWKQFAGCKLKTLTVYNIEDAVKIFIGSEQCAIDTYMLIMKVFEFQDKVTHDLAKDILKDEEEHLAELLDLYEDVTGVKYDDEALLAEAAFEPSENYEPSIQMSDSRTFTKFNIQDTKGKIFPIKKVLKRLSDKSKCSVNISCENLTSFKKVIRDNFPKAIFVKKDSILKIKV